MSGWRPDPSAIEVERAPGQGAGWTFEARGPDGRLVVGTTPHRLSREDCADYLAELHKIGRVAAGEIDA